MKLIDVIFQEQGRGLPHGIMVYCEYSIDTGDMIAIVEDVYTHRSSRLRVPYWALMKWSPEEFRERTYLGIKAAVENLHKTTGR